MKHIHTHKFHFPRYSWINICNDFELEITPISIDQNLNFPARLHPKYKNYSHFESTNKLLLPSRNSLLNLANGNDLFSPPIPKPIIHDVREYISDFNPIVDILDFLSSRVKEKTESRELQDLESEGVCKDGFSAAFKCDDPVIQLAFFLIANWGFRLKDGVKLIDQKQEFELTMKAMNFQAIRAFTEFRGSGAHELRNFEPPSKLSAFLLGKVGCEIAKIELLNQEFQKCKEWIDFSIRLLATSLDIRHDPIDISLVLDKGYERYLLEPLLMRELHPFWIGLKSTTEQFGDIILIDESSLLSPYERILIWSQVLNAVQPKTDPRIGFPNSFLHVMSLIVQKSKTLRKQGVDAFNVTGNTIDYSSRLAFSEFVLPKYDIIGIVALLDEHAANNVLFNMAHKNWVYELNQRN